MAALYIGIILVFRVVQAVFNKRSSIEIKNVPMLIAYNSYKNAISAFLGLFLILIAHNGFKVNALTVLISILSGISLFLSGFFSIYAMKSGTVSLTSMFGTAGMLIPIIAGAVFWGQKISYLQIVGLIIFFISAYLLIGVSKSTYKNFSYKTVLLLIGSLVFNGCTMLSQQLFTRYVPKGDVSVFSFLSFGIIAILSAIVYSALGIKGKGKNESIKLSKIALLCGVALAISVFIINQLATLSTALVSPIVLFAFINGGGTIISTVVAAIIYKEKITKRAIVGVALGVIALIMIKAFG